MTTIGAVVISRNDNYGGDLINKFRFTLTSLINHLDQVYYVDWNSPDKPLIDEVRDKIPHTGKLYSIVIDPLTASVLTKHNPDVQNCVEVLARNIGIRRLNTDWIISTNSDIMILDRESIERNLINENTFHCVARRNMDFPEIYKFEPDSPGLKGFITASIRRYGQYGSGSPLGPRDRWSLISCPGDFQLAHCNLWYTIKGFDEDLLLRGYTDSNVQRKADYYGYQLALVRDIPIFHFNHYPGSGSTGGNTAGWNSDECLFNYQGTRNPDNWGFADLDFDEEVI